MDPITLIVTALAAGAAAGVQGTAASAVKDAYAGLKALVKKRFAGRPDAELILARHERAPDTWQAPLAAELRDAGADRDPDLVTTARALMDLIDGARSWTENYSFDGRGSQGMQVGGHGNVGGNFYNYGPRD
jgi:hypothetical protein